MFKVLKLLDPKAGQSRTVGVEAGDHIERPRPAVASGLCSGDGENTEGF